MALVVLAPGGQSPGLDVKSATIRMPRAGAWTADLVVDAEAAPTGAVDLRIAGERTLKGAVVRAAVYAGMVHMRIAAGGAGLAKVIEPRHFTTPSVRVVLTDILKQVGETLSTTADQAMLAHLLEHWTTRRMPAGRAVLHVIERLPAETGWRLLDDGTFWIGPETWPESQVTDFVELGRAPEDDVVEYGLGKPYARPGYLLGGRKIDAVEITMKGATVRATAWTVP